MPYEHRRFSAIFLRISIKLERHVSRRSQQYRFYSQSAAPPSGGEEWDFPLSFRSDLMGMLVRGLASDDTLADQLRPLSIHRMPGRSSYQPTGLSVFIFYEGDSGEDSFHNSISNGHREGAKSAKSAIISMIILRQRTFISGITFVSPR
jgi:hypothetical protein